MHQNIPTQFVLDTDASASGIRVVVSQTVAKGKEQVVAVLRWNANTPPSAGTASNCHFHEPYLLGRPFNLRTDHGSLTWLRNFIEAEHARSSPYKYFFLNTGRGELIRMVMPSRYPEKATNTSTHGGNNSVVATSSIWNA